MRLGLFLLVLLVCMQLSLGGAPWKKWLKKGSKKLTGIKKKLGSGGHAWKRGMIAGKRGHGHKKMQPDFGKASNPEMLVMMRMKKMLSPLRNLCTKLFDLGPRTYVQGRPSFCGESECPAFKVLNKTSHYELRQYEATTWVSTSIIASSMDSNAQGSLFWPLYKYTQGDNKDESKIAMTLPVVILVKPHPLSDGYNFTMSFFVSPFNKNPPIPKDDKVVIKQKPAFKVYSHSFKGYAWMQDIWERHVDMLADLLDKDGLQYHPRDHMYMTAGYDDPLKMFNRHNEVWLMAM